MRKLTLGVIALAASAMIGSTASQATFTVDVFPESDCCCYQSEPFHWWRTRTRSGVHSERDQLRQPSR